jgi:hypothetical protein
MGYKQKSFPMHQGTSSHTSALKQKTTDKSYVDIEKLIEKDTETTKTKDTKNQNSNKRLQTNLVSDKNKPDLTKDLLESIDEKKDTKTTKTKDIKAQSEEEARLAKEEMEVPAVANQMFPKKEKKANTGLIPNAIRGAKNLVKNIKKYNNPTAEERARRIKDRKSLMEDLDPIWRAMDQPRSTTAKGYFDDEIKKEKRSKKQKRKKKERKENIKRLTEQNEKLVTDYNNLVNKYADADSEDPNNTTDEQ